MASRLALFRRVDAPSDDLMTIAAAVRHVILGTAGHIDHGKTTLVEALTGVRTDRLKEEQERGMTIDVGYAAFSLPDGTEVGLLDVPGHERLVRTMVAGATAMDLALLVVAADDGPMPQTREHVDILDVLGVTRLVVALTKVDVADEGTAEIAEEEVRALLAPTGMRDAPILRVSSVTGEGLDLLRAAIQAALPPAHLDAHEDRVFRMPILRAFSAPGRGTVVTGIPLAGRVLEGEAVEILPPGWAARVRGVQVHHRSEKEAGSGRRTALALSDVSAERVRRGMVVATAGVLKPTRRLAVRLRLLPSDRPLEHRARVRLHLGADQTVARVHVLAGAALAAGETSAVELEAFQDVVAAPGDRFVLRAENASATLGGGVVVEVLDRRLPRRRQGLVEELLRQSERLGEADALVEAHLRAAGDAGTRLAETAARTALRPESIPAVVARLVQAGIAVRLGHDGALWIAKEGFDRVLERVEAGARRLHEKDPALAALPASAIRSAAGRVAPAVLDAAMDALLEDGRLRREPAGGLRHRSHAPQLSDQDSEQLRRVQQALAAGRGQPPGSEDLEADLALSRQEVGRLLKLLVNRGLAFRAGDLYFDAAWIEDAKGRLAAHARLHGGFTPSDARTVLDTTRKWVIPLLEALDKAGFSRRTGDRRVVR